MDIVIGGAGSDLITAGSGDNLVLSDSDQIVAAQSDAPRFGIVAGTQPDGALFGPAMITLGRVMSTAPLQPPRWQTAQPVLISEVYPRMLPAHRKKPVRHSMVLKFSTS